MVGRRKPKAPAEIGGGFRIAEIHPNYGFEIVIWKKLGVDAEKFRSPA